VDGRVPSEQPGVVVLQSVQPRCHGRECGACARTRAATGAAVGAAPTGASTPTGAGPTCQHLETDDYHYLVGARDGEAFRPPDRSPTVGDHSQRDLVAHDRAVMGPPEDGPEPGHSVQVLPLALRQDRQVLTAGVVAPGRPWWGEDPHGTIDGPPARPHQPQDGDVVGSGNEQPVPPMSPFVLPGGADFPRLEVGPPQVTAGLAMDGTADPRIPERGPGVRPVRRWGP
jgi:hypothetical protein